MQRAVNEVPWASDRAGGLQVRGNAGHIPHAVPDTTPRSAGQQLTHLFTASTVNGEDLAGGQEEAQLPGKQTLLTMQGTEFTLEGAEAEDATAEKQAPAAAKQKADATPKQRAEASPKASKQKAVGTSHKADTGAKPTLDASPKPNAHAGESPASPAHKQPPSPKREASRALLP